MIYTVTFNPALDYVIAVDHFAPGQINRTKEETMEAIKDKRVEATIAEPPFFLGKAILNTAYDYLEGKEVEAHVVLDNQLVTQDTVDSLVTKE